MPRNKSKWLLVTGYRFFPGLCTHMSLGTTNTTGGPGSRCEELLFFFYLYANVP